MPEQTDKPCGLACRLDKIVRGTDRTPGHGARLHSAELRIQKLEDNEQDLKDWNKDLRRLYIFVAVSLLGTSVSLIAIFK